MKMKETKEEKEMCVGGGCRMCDVTVQVRLWLEDWRDGCVGL
jgi:hypothetical protein